MPTTLELIQYERMASIISIISSFQGLFSSYKAEEAELEKQRNKTSSSRDKNAARESTQLVLDSTWTGIISYIIFLTTLNIRRDMLKKDIEAGTTNVSIVPTDIIILGLTIALIGSIIRVPAIEQRLSEAQFPVIL